ncbi:MAG: flagellar basal-body MS-ring/collar protein FliF [Candidatus Aquicultor sp.]
MASPAEAIKNAQTGWQKLEVNQKMIIMITVILFVVALGSLIYWVSRPSYSVLFSNLSPEDASSIVTKLQEKKIPYQLSGTQTIQVPSDQVYETRIELAGAGLPQGGTVGFEIFDQSNFGLSEFTQKINYRRALEGELGRTISQINEVDGARVHIVIPEPSLYTDKENPATASVIIKPKPGAKISEGQVQGIVNLISKSVEGLKSENITVVDTSGNVLNEATGDSEAGIAGNYSRTQLEAKVAYESQVEKSIHSMLGTVLGNDNNAVVRVNADLDFTSKQTRTNKVEQGNNPVVVSTQKETEKYEGAGAGPGGIAGISSQNPSSTASGSSVTYPAGTEGGNSTYKRSNETVNYDSTKIEESEIRPPGEVKKLSVAVVVNNDGSKALRDTTIEQLVTAAAGIDTSRGDVLTVSSVPFDTAWMKKEDKAIADAQRSEMYATYGKYAIVAVLFFIGLFALMRVVSSFRPPKSVEEFIPRPLSQASHINITAEDLMEDSGVDPQKKKELLIQQKRRQMAREEIQSLAKERPGDIAQLLRIWLNT